MPVLIDGFLIDAALAESHKRSSTATKFPVESGATFSDHIVRDPRQYVVEGIVSNTPIGDVATARENETAAAGEDLEVLPADEAIARLERIYERSRPVTVQSTSRLYENMTMVDLDIPRDRTTGNALRFTATFEQIVVITNTRSTVRTIPSGQGKAKLGSKAASIIPPGSTVVFTLQYAPTGSSTTYRSTPPWLEGDPGQPVLKETRSGPFDKALGRAVVLGTFAHFKAGPGQVADGYVLGGVYKPFKTPVTMPAVGGSLEQDQAGRIVHAYPVQENPFGTDETSEVVPDAAGETNAQFVHRVYGVAIPGL